MTLILSKSMFVPYVALFLMLMYQFVLFFGFREFFAGCEVSGMVALFSVVALKRDFRWALMWD